MERGRPSGQTYANFMKKNAFGNVVERRVKRTLVVLLQGSDEALIRAEV